MKHIRSTFFLLTTLFIMASCGEDRSGEYYALIGENVWIEQIMKEHYLWYDSIPAIKETDYFVIEQIRTAVIELVHYSEDASKVNLSDYLRERCHRDYSALSKLFSEVNGISIEKYFLAQRIERVKELLAYGDLTVSEIADKLRYSSVAHLSAQFRAQTGMSPTEFRRLKGRGLKPLDEV